MVVSSFTLSVKPGIPLAMGRRSGREAKSVTVGISLHKEKGRVGSVFPYEGYNEWFNG